eukprot:SAG11_NODE_289_length_11184_cov_20.648083_10_plen_42_part_00
MTSTPRLLVVLILGLDVREVPCNLICRILLMWVGQVSVHTK